MEYTISDKPHASTNQKFLQRDKQELACPFQSALPVPGKDRFGNPAMNIIRTPCGLHCPHFRLHQNTVTLTCVQESDRYALSLSENVSEKYVNIGQSKILA